MNHVESDPGLPVQFKGRAWAHGLLRWMGWSVRFHGLPSRQGVLVVYPHTSNWDFVVLVIAKWALGIPVRFWGKDSLFRMPLLGAWLRYLGGVAVERTAAHGVVGRTVDEMRLAQQRNEYFWLALAPEGTRKWIPGWRSGFYRTALQAGVPVGVVALDYGQRRITVTDFLHLTGLEAQDMDSISSVLRDVRGHHPEMASPIRLLDAAVARTDTITK